MTQDSGQSMYLYGASGHAKVIIDVLQSAGIRVSGIFDDNPALETLNGIKVLGKFSGQELDAPLLVSIGNNRVRARIAGKLQFSFGSAVHTSALISPSARIGEGTVVMQGAIIQAAAHIGSHVIINTGASVDHDCFIDNFVHISPGAVLSGNVQVGEGAYVGAGALVIPGVKIGRWCTIGAGAVVIRDIPDRVTAVGNPARIIKQPTNEP
ncbi:acetyltransferase [Nafulsella turpanensis]|uniref:acetyltransferase n=1 Tax=Nafulsella turpanensis TaxID=1265690 RepID=UPI001F28EBE0|nr:acetyltransferase [Nafulsella turpanensis]